MIRVGLNGYFLGYFRGLGDPEVAILTIILSGGMIFRLLALSSGEDASMEQLAGLMYYTTPISKGPGPRLSTRPSSCIVSRRHHIVGVPCRCDRYLGLSRKASCRMVDGTLSRCAVWVRDVSNTTENRVIEQPVSILLESKNVGLINRSY